jgi:DNA-binding NarL/FixJ family response regulator
VGHSEGDTGDARPETIRVLVVDDHEVFASSLAHVLDVEPDLEVIAAVADERGALAHVAECDVVLCDYRLVETDGVALTRQLLERVPSVQVVMLTASTDEAVLVAALEAGCAGFVVKSQPLAEVLAAVRSAASGEPVISSQMLGRLLPRLARTPSTGPELTQREREVLDLMGEGGTNQAIADALYLSRDTVRNHVANILRKLDAHSKLEAVAIAHKRGLLRSAR